MVSFQCLWRSASNVCEGQLSMGVMVSFQFLWWPAFNGCDGQLSMAVMVSFQWLWWSALMAVMVSFQCLHHRRITSSDHCYMHASFIQVITIKCICHGHNAAETSLNCVFQVILRTGMYSAFLQDWLNVFSREHFHFVRSEDFFTNSSKEISETHAFLGVG